MGRDAFFNLLSVNKLLVKKRKTRIITTQSSHWLRKYKNMIKNFTPTEANQLYVSDITYWKIGSGHVYISLITDAFSHKIVGYNLAQTLEAVESIKALEMALNNLKSNEYRLIHHSDRGVQYCCVEYVKLLQDNKIEISMTENGDPLENAIAERINGILKGEYLECYDIETFEEAEKLLHSVIKLYNEERPHMSIGNLTPMKVHDNNIITNKLWKNYWEKDKKS
jgi:transposase InsO family protein